MKHNFVKGLVLCLVLATLSINIKGEKLVSKVAQPEINVVTTPSDLNNYTNSDLDGVILHFSEVKDSNNKTLQINTRVTLSDGSCKNLKREILIIANDGTSYIVTMKTLRNSNSANYTGSKGEEVKAYGYTRATIDLERVLSMDKKTSGIKNIDLCDIYLKVSQGNKSTILQIQEAKDQMLVELMKTSTPSDTNNIQEQIQTLGDFKVYLDKYVSVGNTNSFTTKYNGYTYSYEPSPIKDLNNKVTLSNGRIANLAVYFLADNYDMGWLIYDNTLSTKTFTYLKLKDNRYLIIDYLKNKYIFAINKQQIVDTLKSNYDLSTDHLLIMMLPKNDNYRSLAIGRSLNNAKEYSLPKDYEVLFKCDDCKVNITDSKIVMNLTK